MPNLESGTTGRLHSSLKRQSPPSPSVDCASAHKRARDDLFDAVVTGSTSIASSVIRKINTADDLDKQELIRCFELLHACGQATQPEATLATTRRSIEGFLEAVFNEWGGDRVAEGDEPPRPCVDINIDASVVVGKHCSNPSEHMNHAACDEDQRCVDVTATASYTSNTGVLSLSFVVSGQESAHVCIFTDRNIRWMSRMVWMKQLRSVLENKMLSKVHRYNKHMAVWQARTMIRGWQKGEDQKTWVRGEWEFVGVEQVRMAMMGLGGCI